ncbi:MAG TPA: hypothetical protein VJI32_01055 [Candidatus Nanoarchaeia archaeon]|nr:hypothetical protein [Candidatus Nanoarchaeia archaeon]
MVSLGTAVYESGAAYNDAGRSMKVVTKARLQEKGWKDTDITKAEAALERDLRYDVHFSRIVFWSAIIVIVFANILVAGVLVPLLIALNEWVLYSAVVILAGTVGFLYNFLITDIGHLEKKHHIWAGILVPILALGNIIAVVLLSNRFIEAAHIQNVEQDPYLIGILFAMAFILPYIIDRMRLMIVERKAAGQ